GPGTSPAVGRRDLPETVGRQMVERIARTGRPRRAELLEKPVEVLFRGRELDGGGTLVAEASEGVEQEERFVGSAFTVARVAPDAENALHPVHVRHPNPARRRSPERSGAREAWPSRPGRGRPWSPWTRCRSSRRPPR